MSSLSGFAVLDAPVTPRVRVRSWHHRSGPTEFPAGTHAFVEVAWVLEGRATYTVGDRELVAGHKVEHIVTRTIDDAMIPTPQLDAPFLGVLPTGYLRHFLMTVDYPAGKLRLDGYADLPPREPDSFFALGIGFEQVTSPPIHVTQVLPGSSAADEGIAVGDELVKVGGADFGRDAMSKAKRIVDATRSAIERSDTEAVKEQIEQLQRTERMFKGVVARS